MCESVTVRQRQCNRLLLALISAVLLDRVAQLTAFTGPIKSRYGKRTPCYTSQGKPSSHIRFQAVPNEVWLSWDLFGPLKAQFWFVVST